MFNLCLGSCSGSSLKYTKASLGLNQQAVTTITHNNSTVHLGDLRLIESTPISFLFVLSDQLRRLQSDKIKADFVYGSLSANLAHDSSAIISIGKHLYLCDGK